MKSLVDQGQIKIGMPADAVYIAWGRPGEILHSENQAGKTTTWLYYGSSLEETRFWGRYHLNTYYQPVTYVRAEVIFINDHVLEWRTLPAPVY